MMLHKLKTHPPFFGHVYDGTKTFEVRRADRDFRVGDTLSLEEWDPVSEEYTGRRTLKSVTYVLPGPGFGLEAGHVIMGLGSAAR